MVPSLKSEKYIKAADDYSKIVNRGIYVANLIRFCRKNVPLQNRNKLR